MGDTHTSSYRSLMLQEALALTPSMFNLQAPGCVACLFLMDSDVCFSAADTRSWRPEYHNKATSPSNRDRLRQTRERNPSVRLLPGSEDGSGQVC